MHFRVSKSVSRVAALAFAVMLPVAMVAQDTAKPAVKAPAADVSSKWDIFAGYSFLAPNANVTEFFGPFATPQQTVDFSNVYEGMTASGAYYFKKNLGIQLEVSESGLMTNNYPSNNDGFFTTQGGLIYRIPSGRITPFVHVLVGGADVDGPEHNPRTWGIGMTAGGGLDYELNKHWAIRFVQADIEPMHVNFGNRGQIYGGVADINDAIRLSAGIVYHAGEQIPPPPVTLALAVSPASVFPGETVSATATPGSLDPKLNAIYGWTGTGVTGNGTSATIATAALAPGTYTVKAEVKEGKPGKEGLKPGQAAEASASFTVKAWEPPTISCSAAPTTIKPGETSTVSAMAVSPQNRPLTYSYSATAGMVSGNGATATFSSTGAPTGTVSITCNVADDKDHTATATTNVTILAPYVPPVLHSEELSPLAFEAGKNEQSSARVNNEVKAILDGVALTMQKQPDAKVVIVGESTATEKTAADKLAKRSHKKGAKPEDLAAQRAVNTKDYLVKEKGIDPSRISVAEGTKDEQKVEIYLVPAGANFSADVHDVTPVDESAVKPQVRKALPAAHHHAKKAM
jgi:hypothetical protein